MHNDLYDMWEKTYQNGEKWLKMEKGLEMSATD